MQSVQKKVIDFLLINCCFYEITALLNMNLYRDDSVVILYLLWKVEN